MRNAQEMEQAVRDLFSLAGLEYSFPEVTELLNCRSREDKIELSLALQKLLKKKFLEENAAGKFILFGADKPSITGKVDFVNPRFAYIRLEGGDKSAQDVMVQADELRGAQDGDLVELDIFPGRKGKKAEGIVSKVLQRARNQVAPPQPFILKR